MFYYVNLSNVPCAVRLYEAESTAQQDIELGVLNADWRGPYDVPTRAELVKRIRDLECWEPTVRDDRRAWDVVCEIREAEALLDALDREG